MAGSSPFVRLSTGPSSGSAATTSPKARLGTAITTSSAPSNGASSSAAPRTPVERDVREVPRVALRLRDRARLVGVARGERHVVPALQRARARTPCPRRRLRRRRPSRAPDEVDRHGHALELEPLAELVLDPVAVVARDQARVVDEEAEAGRAHGRLGAVEEVQPLPVSRRRLAGPPAARRGSGSARRSGCAPCTCRRAPRRGRGPCPRRASSSPRRRRSAAAGAGAARAARARPRSRPRRCPTWRGRRASRTSTCARCRRSPGPARRRPRSRRRGRARRRRARRPAARAAPSSTRSPGAACACAGCPRCRRARTSARRASSTVSIESRVVPGCSETITRSSPSSALSRLDLPTFGRPRIATRIASSPASAGPAARAGARRSRRAGRRCRGRGAPRDRDRVAEAEAVELERLRLAAGLVDLVRDQEDRLVRAAQDRGELLVAGRDPGPRVDDEEDEVGLGDRACAPARRPASSAATGRRCRRRRCRRAGSAAPPTRRRAPCGRA